MKRILLICLLATFMPYTAARSQDFSDSELSSELDQLENEIDQGEDFFNESADSGSAKDEFSEFEDDDFGDETTSESFDEEFGEDTAQEEVKPSEEPTDEFGEDEFGDEEVTETPKEEAVEKPEEAPQEQSFEEPEEQVVEPEPEEVDPGPTETIQEEVVHSEPLPMIDDPDLSYEAKLHSIYLNYHNEPTSDERWHEIVGNKASQTYVIQRGDTLWGISKILFGDGHFWPKVWSLNGAITNPHIIKEGNSIRFLMGDEGSEPAFTITEGNAEAMGAEDYDAGSLEEDVEIPPPGISSRQTIAHLPPSIEEFKIKKSDKTFDQLGFAGVKKVDRFLDKQTLLDYYVDEKEPKYIGLVKEVEGSLLMAVDNQYVYVSSDSDLSTNSYLTVVKSRGELASDDEFTIEGDPKIFEIQGLLKVVGYIGKGNNDKNLYRAYVVKVITTIDRDSFVVPGKLQVRNIAKPNAITTISGGQIVGGSKDTRQKLYNVGERVFINKGKNQGVRRGVASYIYSNRLLRNSETVVAKSFRKIGILKVIDVKDNFSTAVVIAARNEVLAGDFVYNPSGLDGGGIRYGSLTSRPVSLTPENKNQQEKKVKDSSENKMEKEENSQDDSFEEGDAFDDEETVQENDLLPEESEEDDFDEFAKSDIEQDLQEDEFDAETEKNSSESTDDFGELDEGFDDF